LGDQVPYRFYAEAVRRFKRPDSSSALMIRFAAQGEFGLSLTRKVGGPVRAPMSLRVGFESAKQSHCQHGRLILKGLWRATLASFGFVLTCFSGRFIDSIGLSGFVL